MGAPLQWGDGTALRFCVVKGLGGSCLFAPSVMLMSVCNVLVSTLLRPLFGAEFKLFVNRNRLNY